MTAVGPGRRWRWLVTDVDGTLVDDNQRVIERNRVAVQQFVADGGQVILATGRKEDSARRFHDALGLPGGPAILYNGAQVYDFGTDTVLMEHHLTGGDAAAIVGSRLPGVQAVVAFVDGRARVAEDGGAYREYAAKDSITLEPVASWADLDGRQVTKFLLIAPPDAMPELARAVSGRVGRARLVRSENTYLEVLPAGATKGSALRWLAADRGVPLAEVAAVGDNQNDVEMLAEAGLGVAVGDGHPVLRAAADVVVCRCADGAVADALDLMARRRPGAPDEAAEATA